LPYTAYTLSLDTAPYELKPETEGTVNVIYEDITHDIIIFARKILSISAGSSSSYIVKEDGTSWGTGYNRSGELGLEIEE